MIQHVCQERTCNLIYHSPCTQSVTAADREHARTVTHEVGNSARAIQHNHMQKFLYCVLALLAQGNCVEGVITVI